MHRACGLNISTHTSTFNHYTNEIMLTFTKLVTQTFATSNGHENEAILLGHRSFTCLMPHWSKCIVSEYDNLCHFYLKLILNLEWQCSYSPSTEVSLFSTIIVSDVDCYGKWKMCTKKLQAFVYAKHSYQRCWIAKFHNLMICYTLKSIWENRYLYIIQN